MSISEKEFAAVQRGLEQKVIAIVTIELLKHGYYGVEPSPTAPGTWEDLQARRIVDIAKGRRLFQVWDGASESSMYGKPQVNYMARAWHDLKHLDMGLGFSDDDELVVGSMQSLDGRLNEIERMLVWMDTVGQTEFKIEHGEFPVDQKQFVLDGLNQMLEDEEEGS